MERWNVDTLERWNVDTVGGDRDAGAVVRGGAGQGAAAGTAGAGGVGVEDRRERLAGLAHEMWSGWMVYLFSKCACCDDGSALMPAWAVERWQRQAATPYAALTEDEKDSDRHEAERMLAVTGGE